MTPQLMYRWRSIAQLVQVIAERPPKTYNTKCVYMNPADEIVTIVDENNTVVGAMPRRVMRAGRLPHRSTYILVFNSQGQLYVQKRTMTKDVYPGYFDIAAGGVVLAGESYAECAQRELAEELGIANVPLTWLFEFYYTDTHARVWGGVFSCVYDGAMVLQAEEVESGTFMAPRDIPPRAKTEPFTPDGLYVLSRYLGDVTPTTHSA